MPEAYVGRRTSNLTFDLDWCACAFKVHHGNRDRGSSKQKRERLQTVSLLAKVKLVVQWTPSNLTTNQGVLIREVALFQGEDFIEFVF